jgi:tetratricopeptide (TPR) repeat protein
MLPPSPMLAQIKSFRGAWFVLPLVLLLAGCTPAGPRALLKGKKYLDRGDVAGAVTQFKRATTLLATNAGAWNYFGVALQRAGQPDEAANAYQTALRLDHDLMEAHYNLGMLSLEQNRPDAARTEFTAYTLRRPNDPAGWLKLGFAQLKAGDTFLAERSFSTVHALKGDDAEAYNGLGLAYLQAGQPPRDAAKFFVAATQSRADFAPALLNLATVNLQYLHDSKAALAYYLAYLALNPRPADYDDVKAIVASLAPSDIATTVISPAVVIRTSTPPEPKPKLASGTTPRSPPATRTELPEASMNHVSSRPNSGETTAPVTAIKPVPTQIVQVQPETQIVVSPRTNPTVANTVVVVPKPATNPVASTGSVEVPMPEEQPKTGFWHRIFAYSKPGPAKQNHDDTLTPIPAVTDEMAGTKASDEKPPEPPPTLSPATSIARYNYTSPAKPAPGDRRTAEGPFTKARLAEQDANWLDAQQWYQTAADEDPSWFEAQYNTGVIAHRLRNFTVALPRYELALAIQPDSVDARYNFSLALKASGYPADAADELKKILAAHPDEIRAHLALANLCAQSLHDIPEARQHYLKVLDLQPDNPQAADIRFWIDANSK